MRGRATPHASSQLMSVRRGMPMLLLSAGQAGATAPAPIALAIVQAMAECLAGVVYVNAIKKGAPAIFGTFPDRTRLVNHWTCCWRHRHESEDARNCENPGQQGERAHHCQVR